MLNNIKMRTNSFNVLTFHCLRNRHSKNFDNIVSKRLSLLQAYLKSVTYESCYQKKGGLLITIQAYFSDIMCT
jgi:hypothetical protein